jgi:hypothetical protein
MKTQSDFMVEFVQADIACGVSKASIIKRVAPSVRDDLKDALNPDGRSFNTKHEAYTAMRKTFLHYAVPMYLELETIPKGYSKAQVTAETKAWKEFSDSIRAALGDIRERVRNTSDICFRRFIAACFEIESKRGKTEPKAVDKKIAEFFDWLSKKNKAEYDNAIPQARLDAMQQDIIAALLKRA